MGTELIGKVCDVEGGIGVGWIIIFSFFCVFDGTVVR